MHSNHATCSLPGVELGILDGCSNISFSFLFPSIGSSSLYYCNVPFMSSGLINSLKLTCIHGVTKDSGRALVSFALMYSTWYECLDNIYELGKYVSRQRVVS